MTSETQLKHGPTPGERLWHWLVTLSILLRWVGQLVMVAIVFVVMRTLFWWKPNYKKEFIDVVDEMQHTNVTKLDVSDWQDTFFQWQHYKHEATRILRDLYKTVYPGGPVDNVTVITLEGKKAKLLDYSTDEERPLVVNLGSCT